MTKVKGKTKYASIDISGHLIGRLDIWRKGTDGIGRFNLKLKNDNNEWQGQFLPDDPLELLINDVVFLRGYLDKGYPISEDREDIYRQTFELAGRDYGQDLMNKLVNKIGDWMYKKQPADDIIDDMLAKAESEITFTSPHTAPEIQYTDMGEEFLIEAFRKIAEKINYDFFVDEFKVLHFFPIGGADSEIVLKCVAGAADNNILGPIRKTEFDAYELRNYILAKSGDIDDGWSEGNAVDGYYGATGNVVSDDIDIVQDGTGSIRSALGEGTCCELKLGFPKYGYSYLPFDLFEEKIDFIFWLYVDIPGYPWMWPWLYIELEDDQGLKIRYCFCTGLKGIDRNSWHQYSVPVGKSPEIKIKKYTGSYVINEWRYSADPGELEFNWKIKLVRWHAKTYTYEQVANLYLDGMKIPLPMVSYQQSGESQELYKVRHYPVMAKDVHTQKELDEFAVSELEKREEPVTGLKITALGSAGIIGGICVWTPGYRLKVHSPGDGINNVWYRIVEVHVIVTEEPIKSGQDFIAEVTLVPLEAKVSGKRLDYVETPETALFRALDDKIRFLEKKEEGKHDYWPPPPLTLAGLKDGMFFGEDGLAKWTAGFWTSEYLSPNIIMDYLNLLRNGGFEVDSDGNGIPDHWALEDASWESEGSYEGTYHVKIVKPVSGKNSIWSDEYWASTGIQIVLRFFCKNDIEGGKVRACIHCFTSEYAYIDTIWADYDTTTEWKMYLHTGVLPENTVVISVGFENLSTFPAGNVIRVDAVGGVPQITSPEIQDGAVTPPKLDVDLDDIEDGETYAKIQQIYTDAGKALVKDLAQIADDLLTVAKIKDWVISPTAPESPTQGMIWLDTSQFPPEMKRYDGTNWVRMDIIALVDMQGDLDDVTDGSTYGKILLTQLQAGKVLLAQVTGDLDDVKNGTTYGKVLLTSISAGKILLTQCLGDIDDILDGTTFGKVKLTDISAGHILLSSCIGSLDNISDGNYYGKVDISDIQAGSILIGKCIDSDGFSKMPENWRKTEDVTLIDGGKIYTGTIVANAIGANQITSAKITATEWIEAKKFRTGVSGGRVEFDTSGIRIYQDYFKLYDVNNDFRGAISATTMGIQIVPVGHILLNPSVGNSVIVLRDIIPNIANVPNCGTATKYWLQTVTNYLYASQALPRLGSNTGSVGVSDRYWQYGYFNSLNYKTHQEFDTLDDLALIKAAKTKKFTKQDGSEINIYDLDSLPFLKPDEGGDFWDSGKSVGFLMGCIRQLLSRVEELEKKVEQAKN